METAYNYTQFFWMLTNIAIIAIAAAGIGRLKGAGFPLIMVSSILFLLNLVIIFAMQMMDMYDFMEYMSALPVLGQISLVVGLGLLLGDISKLKQATGPLQG